MSLVIYHNPRCSKSRQTLALLRERGLEPEIVLYLESPPSEAGLEELLDMLGMPARDLMRRKEAPYRELGLDDPSLTRAEARGRDGFASHPHRAPGSGVRDARRDRTPTRKSARNPLKPPGRSLPSGPATSRPDLPPWP